MNIHEYQAKEILKSFGVAIQEGIVADSADKAVEAAKELRRVTGTGWWVLKSQIHAGGRGKGKIVGTEQRGVALAKNLEQVEEIARQNPNVAKFIEGQIVKKIIVVPSKLVNIVV